MLCNHLDHLMQMTAPWASSSTARSAEIALQECLTPSSKQQRTETGFCFLQTPVPLPHAAVLHAHAVRTHDRYKVVYAHTHAHTHACNDWLATAWARAGARAAKLEHSPRKAHLHAKAAHRDPSQAAQQTSALPARATSMGLAPSVMSAKEEVTVHARLKALTLWRSQAIGGAPLLSCRV